MSRRIRGVSRGAALLLLLLAGSDIEAQAPESLVAGPIGVSPQSYHELRARARRQYQAGDLEGAAASYGLLVRAYPWDSGTWWSLGFVQYRRGRFDAAADALGEADRLGVSPSARWLPGFAAMAHARAGEPDSALHWLERAIVGYRYEAPRSLLEDSTLATLAEDPRYRALAGPRLPSGVPRTTGWNADLDHLLAQIRRVNPALTGGSLPASLQREAERLRRDIPSLSDAQIAVGLQRLLAMLGQSHNNLYFPFAPGYSGRVGFTSLPLTLYYFPDGLYVIDAEASHADLIGARVLRFGTTDTEAASQAVARLIARDNEMQIAWNAPTYLRVPEVLQAVGVIPDARRVDLTIADATGRVRVVALEPVSPKPRPKLSPSRVPGAPEPPLYLRDVSEAHWFEPLPEQRALYVQFNQVENEPEESLAAFGLRLRVYLAEHPEIANVVLDLRHNNGGDTYLYTEVLRTLIAFDAREPGHLFVIAGRNTFSAAQNFAVDLDRLTEAVFVGEPTGGRPEAYGDSPSFVLPYSGLEGGTAAVVWNLSSPRDRRPWIAPDVPVALTAPDYFANRDPILAATLALIR